MAALAELREFAYYPVFSVFLVWHLAFSPVLVIITQRMYSPRSVARCYECAVSVWCTKKFHLDV